MSGKKNPLSLTPPLPQKPGRRGRKEPQSQQRNTPYSSHSFSFSLSLSLSISLSISLSLSPSLSQLRHG